MQAHVQNKQLNKSQNCSPCFGIDPLWCWAISLDLTTKPQVSSCYKTFWKYSENQNKIADINNLFPLLCAAKRQRNEGNILFSSWKLKDKVWDWKGISIFWSLEMDLYQKIPKKKKSPQTLTGKKKRKKWNAFFSSDRKAKQATNQLMVCLGYFLLLRKLHILYSWLDFNYIHEKGPIILFAYYFSIIPILPCVILPCHRVLQREITPSMCLNSKNPKSKQKMGHRNLIDILGIWFSFRCICLLKELSDKFLVSETSV